MERNTVFLTCHAIKENYKITKRTCQKTTERNTVQIKKPSSTKGLSTDVISPLWDPRCVVLLVNLELHRVHVQEKPPGGVLFGSVCACCASHTCTPWRLSKGYGTTAVIVDAVVHRHHLLIK